MSTYPPQLPPKDRVNTTPQGDAHPSDHNLIAQALEAIIGVLGQDPAGAAASLTARLDNWKYSRGLINGLVAQPANPATEFYSMPSPTPDAFTVLSWAGMGPVPIVSEGGRTLRIDGVVRIDGGGLTSNAGFLEFAWQRRTAGVVTQRSVRYIATVSAYAGDNDSSRVVPFIGYDTPPAGNHQYELDVSYRGGVGPLRIGGGTGLAVTDVGTPDSVIPSGLRGDADASGFMLG